MTEEKPEKPLDPTVPVPPRHIPGIAKYRAEQARKKTTPTKKAAPKKTPRRS